MACAVGCLLLAAGAGMARAQQNATTRQYARALALRTRLDATPASARTGAEYTQALNAFRAVYHADRAAPDAAPSVEAVAELLAAEGRLFRDPSLLRAAVAQLDFLRRDFAATPFAAPALLSEGEIELRDLADRATAEAKFAEFLQSFPSSPLASQARAELRRLGVRTPSAPVYTTAPTQTVARRSLRGAPAAADDEIVGDETQKASQSLPRNRALTGALTGAETRTETSSGTGTETAGSSPAPRQTQPAPAPLPGMWTPAPAPETDNSTHIPARMVASVPVYRGHASQPARILPRAPLSSGQLVPVNGIRHWSTANYTRVVVDVGAEVPFEASRVSHPDRIFFDFHGARLASDLAGRAVTVSDGGFLERIRAAQFSNDVVRVVLDVSDVSDYSAFWLPNPSRLIIDIHGRPRGAPPPVYIARNPAPDASETPQPDNAQTAQREPPSSAGSLTEKTLPPPVATAQAQRRSPSASSVMADASGHLTPSARAARAGAPQPRAVRTADPGTFVAQTTAAGGAAVSPPSRSGDSLAAIAAISQQPTRVRATAQPTLAPIASGTPADNTPPAESAAVTRRRRHANRAVPAEAPAPTPGEEARAAEPDALGGRSMVRALGLKINRIVIDAGHGGHDSGTLGPGGIEEKNVVLDVALRLGKLLKQDLGADVIYTRDDDTFIPLETRTAIANKAQADLFISIHANSSPDPSARGVETYYLNFTTSADALEVAARENAVSDESIHQLSDLVKKITLQDKIEESREFAGDVQQNLYKGLENGNPGLKDRGVKKAPFVVLIGANMPSILAEISFLTNPHSAEELRDPAYRERIAEALYHGVAEYVRSLSSAPTQESAAAEGSRIQ